MSTSNNGFIRNMLAALGIAGACALVTTAVSCTVTKKFLSVAIDRKEPKTIAKTKRTLSGSKSLDKVFIKQAKAAEKLEKDPGQTVEIKAFDGVRLVGHYKKSPDPVRTVICFHGWRSSWSKDYGMISEFLEANNCSVLYVEQRGQNNSSGNYMGFGLLERYDCLSWINYVISLGDGLPIYLSGLSMGATTVMMAAEFERPKQVHGITADCGFTSPNAIWKYITEKNLHLPYTGLRANLIADICRRKLNSENSRYSSCDALAKTKTPVLFIHGAADNFVPVRMTYENYLACASPKRLLIVPGADHGMSYLVEKEKYQQTVRDFWRDFDCPSEERQ